LFMEKLYVAFQLLLNFAICSQTFIDPMFFQNY
jgi:hypothetical protein